MSEKSGCVISMKALGRKFTIGTLYNCIDDTVIPNIRLWDPKEVNRIAEGNDLNDTAVEVLVDDYENGPLVSQLGIDDHSAMSLMAGLMMTPHVGGAWRYAVDRSNLLSSCESASLPSQVVVHCRYSSRNVSVLRGVDELGVICLTERLAKSRATHVVVAVTYGAEAFCLFSAGDKVTKEVINYAEHFANSLKSGRDRLDLDFDEEGDEEDGGQHFLSPGVRCVMYSDWTTHNGDGDSSGILRSMTEQYKSCRMILNHPAVKAVPIAVWLLPLKKLSPLASDRKIANMRTDVSSALVNRCLSLWNRLRRISADLCSIKKSIERSAWMPRRVRDRVVDCHRIIVEFLLHFRQSAYDAIVNIRQGSSPEEGTRLAATMDLIESKRSPFEAHLLSSWVSYQKEQIKALETLANLDGVQLITDAAQLKKAVTSVTSADEQYAVVLHQPHMAKCLDEFVDIMKRSIALKPTLLDSSSCDEPEITMTTAPDHRLIVSEGQRLSRWVTTADSEKPAAEFDVKYIIYYDQEEKRSSNRAPFMQLYDCSNGGEIIFNNFEIPRPPTRMDVADNRRARVTMEWEVDDVRHVTGFLVQYRVVGDLCWQSMHCGPAEMGVNVYDCTFEEELQQNCGYEFRVSSVTLGGNSVFCQARGEVTVDAICPSPDQLRIKRIGDTFIELVWNHDASLGDYVTCDADDPLQLSSYSVECWEEEKPDSTIIQRPTTDKAIVIEPLMLGTTYCVQVRAECTDRSGSTYYSPPTDVLRVRTLANAERAADTVRHQAKLCVGSTLEQSVYALPLKKHVRHDVSGQGVVGRYYFGEPTLMALMGKRRQRTILVLGASGSGKSTLINAMTNYILGIKWDDDFRFKLIDEQQLGRSQAHSQTELITTYDLYEVKGTRLGYSLTVVDTPGFGDTRGIERDKQIMEQIDQYFKSPHGVVQLDAICFVVTASLPRLTESQRYVFDSILAIFGQDVKDNIMIMVTFADSDVPPVLDAVKSAGIPALIDPATGQPRYHKFNNSIFFESNRSDAGSVVDETNRIYFDMAVENFDNFFSDLSRIEAKSLAQTREVLEERKRLEALIQGLFLKTEWRLTKNDEFEQLKKVLTENKQQMEANKDFEFEVEFLVPKETDISGTGQFTTNCQVCRKTCHFPCSKHDDREKRKCSVMDSAGQCRICSCSWNNHFNQKYKYDVVKEKVKRSSDTIRKQYQGAAAEALTNEQLLAEIQKEMDDNEEQIKGLVSATFPHIARLNEIALQPHPLSAPAYIDLLIAGEKQHRLPGHQQKIDTLCKLRKMAEMTAKLVLDQMDDG